MRSQPDLIEVGDAFHPAWCAAAVAHSRNIPLIAFFHSNLAQLLGRRFGAGVERALTPLPALGLWPIRSGAGAEPVDVQLSDAPRSAAHSTAAARGRHQDILAGATHARSASLAASCPTMPGCWSMPADFPEEKNLNVLQLAMALLGKPYHLLLVGGGRSARPSDNITVLPYRRDSLELAQWLASADALVHAGSSETFGLVIVEAMACGRPVVGVRAGAVPELVDERVGELAEPDDAPSMAAAIRRLYERDLDALGSAARQRVLQSFTWSHSIGVELANYASVFAGRRALPVVAADLEFDSPSS